MMIPNQALYPSPSLNGKVDGVMVGTVTNNQDPDNLCRVKVKLQFREGENETDWIRIATMMVGKDKGSLFVPEVGDEVLVAFHMGEVRKPYVIGMLWTKKETPPKIDKDNNIRKIKSREGHELIFDDKKDNGKITIKTKGGTIIELDDKNDFLKFSDSKGQNSMDIAGGNKGEITIKSGSNKITINNKGDISIESMKSIKLKSVEVNIEASANMNIKAGGMLNINSNGMANLKGSMVKIN